MQVAGAAAPGSAGLPPGTPVPNAAASDPAKSRARKDYFMNALAQEPQQKWNRIQWCASTAPGAQRAREQRKPLFIEMIVGRMGRASSGVC